MAKKKKKRPAARKKRQTRKFQLPFKSILTNRIFLTILFSLAVLAGIVYGTGYFFLNSPLFSVREIVVNKDPGYPFSAGDRKLKDRYIGHNIFRVDLRHVRFEIKESYPHLKKVEVRRVLPDRIEVDIVSRNPVAYIVSGENIAIDREGIILGDTKNVAGLIEVKGMSFFFAPARGKKIEDKRLASALVLIDGLRKKMSGHYTDLKYVDVSNRRNLVLGVNGVKVKMGQSDFTRKIDKLSQILRDPSVDLDDINYIDLRFEEAVISPK